MAAAMILAIFSCTKMANEHELNSNLTVSQRAPISATASDPLPTRFEDWYYGDDQIRFCSGLGWNCWPSLDPENPEPYDGHPPSALHWPLTEPDEDSPMVSLSWEEDASLKMAILTPFPSYESILEETGGNEKAARWSYDLMRKRVKVELPVILDERICAMLFEHYAGQRIKLLPGEYSIQANDENYGEVIIPVELY